MDVTSFSIKMERCIYELGGRSDDGRSALQPITRGLGTISGYKFLSKRKNKHSSPEYLMYMYLYR